MKADSDELQSLVSVADSDSVSAAAEQARLAASAVSRALSRLEYKPGTTLLNRATRRMELIKKDRYLFGQARQILQQMEALEKRPVLRRQNPARRLRINATSPFMLHAVVPHIDEFRRLYPDIQLELNTDDLVIDLLEQRTDMAIRVDTLSDSTLHTRPLGINRLHILTSPEYSACHGIPTGIEGLRGHILLDFTQPEHLNYWPVAHADDNRLEIWPDISAPSDETLHQLTLSHQGTTCLASSMTDRDIQDGCLVSLFAEQMSEHRQPIHAVYYRNSQLMLCIQYFLNSIQQRLGA